MIEQMKKEATDFAELVEEVRDDCDRCPQDCRYRLQWLDSIVESQRYQLAKILAMNLVLLQAANLVAEEDYLDSRIRRLTARIPKEETKNRDHQMTASKKKLSPIGNDQILLREIRKSPPVLINGTLPGEGGMLLAGESEIGKSFMRAEWSVLLACGLPIYGMKIPHTQTIRVFQTENSLSTEKKRIQRIMADHGIESVHNRIH